MGAHFEVLSQDREGRRRNRKWPDELKAEVVAETLRPGATINAVAARHGVAATQVSTWRRMAREGKLVLPSSDDAVEFVSLMAAPPTQAERQSGDADAGRVEIVVGAVTVRLEPDATPDRIAVVVRALA